MKGMKSFCKKTSCIRDADRKKWRERKSNKLRKNGLGKELNKKSGKIQGICWGAYSLIKAEGKKNISKPERRSGDKEKIISSFVFKDNSNMDMIMKVEVTPFNLFYKELKNGEEKQTEVLRLEEFSVDFLCKKIKSFF